MALPSPDLVAAQSKLERERVLKAQAADDVASQLEGADSADASNEAAFWWSDAAQIADNFIAWQKEGQSSLDDPNASVYGPATERFNMWKQNEAAATLRAQDALEPSAPVPWLLWGLIATATVAIAVATLNPSLTRRALRTVGVRS